VEYRWEDKSDHDRYICRCEYTGVHEGVRTGVNTNVNPGVNTGVNRNLDSSGQPYPFGHHDRLLTEDDDAAADTYESEADDAAYGGDEL